MGSVDCSYALAKQLQIHLESEKKVLLTPWKWFSNRSRRRDSSLTTGSNGVCVSDHPKLPVDSDFLSNRIIDFDLSSIIQLPPGIDLNEWLASQTIFLFDSINMLYGCLSEFCTPVTCPSMSGPANVQYYWPDDKNKKCKFTAIQYVDCVTSYASSCIDDEAVFPTKYGNAFPSTFHQTVKNINRLLCHLLIHTHHAHTKHLKSLDLAAHYCTVLYHFLLFNKHFSLANQTDISIFDDIFKVLDTLVTVPKMDDPHLSSLPCDATNIEASTHSCNSIPAAQVTSQRSAVDSNVKNDDSMVDKFVPVFTIVT